MNPLFIVNPRSSGGRTGEVFDAMRRPIERIVGPFDVAFTERSRHATELAEEAANGGRETVVAVGGDGSIHEVVAGLMRARDAGTGKHTRLGILGQGTGGDFRRTLGIEHRLDAYCKVIAGGKTRTTDVGRFSYQTHGGDSKVSYFINILSAGMGGLVDQYVAEMSHHMGGTLKYLVASLRGTIESKIGQLKCTAKLHGEPRVEHFSTRVIAICNGRYFGSGMHVAPMALPDDGVFEVVSLGDAPKLKFALTSSRIYSGKHMGAPETLHFQCNEIEVELQNEEVADKFCLDVDGEPLGRLPIKIEVVPGALQVLVP